MRAAGNEELLQLFSRGGMGRGFEYERGSADRGPVRDSGFCGWGYGSHGLFARTPADRVISVSATCCERGQPFVPPAVEHIPREGRRKHRPGVDRQGSWPPISSWPVRLEMCNTGAGRRFPGAKSRLDDDEVRTLHDPIGARRKVCISVGPQTVIRKKVGQQPGKQSTPAG